MCPQSSTQGALPIFPKSSAQQASAGNRGVLPASEAANRAENSNIFSFFPHLFSFLFSPRKQHYLIPWHDLL